MDKESTRAITEIEELKHLVKKKEIQNNALQKIINELSESENKNQ